jgi:hypothetical protein
VAIWNEKLKVPGHKHDEAFFARLQHDLLKQRGIVSVDVNPLIESVIIVHDGALDPRTEERQPRQHGAPQVDLAARRGSREPSSRGADLTSLAIELVLGAITRELSSLIIELILISPACRPSGRSRESRRA